MKGKTRYQRGDVIGDHYLVKDFTRGGMGEIYFCRDQKEKRDVAIKILQEKLLSRPTVIQSYLQEAATWIRHPERLVGFDGLFFHHGPITTLVASPTLTPRIRALVEDFIRSLGRLTIWVQDSPGLILPRIICMLANEAAFSAGEGVAEIDIIDKAMQLGTNYPKGPLAWAKEIGYARVTTVLDHLQFEYGEE